MRQELEKIDKESSKYTKFHQHRYAIEHFSKKAYLSGLKKNNIYLQYLNKLIHHNLEINQVDESFRCIKEFSLNRNDYLHKPYALELICENIFLQGKYHFINGNYWDAIENFKDALEIFNEQESFFLKEEIYFWLGKTFIELGDFEQGRAVLALTITSYSIVVHKCAELNTVLGMSYWHQNNLVKAEKYFNKVFNAQKSIKKSTFQKVRINCLIALSNFYWKKGKFESEANLYLKSKEYLFQARRVSKNFEIDPVLFNRIKNAEVIIQVSEGNYQDSLDRYSEFLSEYIKRLGARNPLVSRTHNDIGYLYLRLKKNELALESFQNAIQANVSDFDAITHDFIPQINNIFDIKSYRNLLFSLEYSADSLINSFRKKRFKNYLWEALNTLKVASNVIEHLKTNFNPVYIRFFHIYRTRKICEKLLEVSNTLLMIKSLESEQREYVCGFAYKMLELTKTFDLSERSIWLINKRAVSTFLNVEEQAHFGPLEYTSNLELNESFDGIKEEFEIHSIKNSILSQFVEEKTVELSELENLKEKLDNKFKRAIKSRQGYKAEKEFEISSLGSLMNNLEGEDGAILSYFIGTKSSFVFAIRKRYYSLVKVSKGEDVYQIPFWIRKLKDLLPKGFVDFDKRRKYEFINYSTRLYNVLFRKLEEHLSNIKRIYIIPDKVLFNVPFDVLINDVGFKNGLVETLGTELFKEVLLREQEYLVKNYDISYHYSCSLLNESYGADIRKKNGEKKQLSIFCPLSPLELKGTDYLSNLIYGFKKKYDHLFDHTNTFIDKKAFKRNFLNTGTLSLILHVSTHTENEKGSSKGGIVFHDGILTIEDIFKETWSWDTELLVLACCRASFSKIDLIQTFIFSGIKNVVFTFFDIAEGTSSELLEDYYENIFKNGLYIGEALHLAKKRKLLLAKTKDVLPLHWAGFSMIGHQKVDFKTLFR